MIEYLNYIAPLQDLDADNLHHKGGKSEMMNGFYTLTIEVRPELTRMEQLYDFFATTSFSEAKKVENDAQIGQWLKDTFDRFNVDNFDVLFLMNEDSIEYALYVNEDNQIERVFWE